MKKIVLIILLILLSVDVKAQSLSKALNDKMGYLIARQAIVSGNIANASTPNYLAKDIKFSPRKSKGTLPMRSTSSKHFNLSGNSLSKYEKTEDRTFIRNDGNSVRIDEQMLKLAKIQQEYNLATKLYAKHMAMQKMAVQAK